MLKSLNASRLQSAEPIGARPWDARLAARLVAPLKHSNVSPNHLTTLRLLIGLAGAACFMAGGYAWSNAAAVLIALSNFVDHTDGELARMSGKTSRIGHVYDLASDALVTVLLFVGIGVGVARLGVPVFASPVWLGCIAGAAVALIFWLRMKIEASVGKARSKQVSFGGFEAEDILYLLPLVTVCGATRAFLVAAAIGAPLFLIFVMHTYWRQVGSRAPRLAAVSASPPQPAVSVVNGGAFHPLDAVDPDDVLRRWLGARGASAPSETFHRQGEFLFLDEFLPPEITRALIACTRAVQADMNRNYLPGHKQGGSVSRHMIDERIPFIAELYRSPTLIHWLEQCCGERLLPSPPDDPHAYALYFYTRPGDHIGWHYDTSYYEGKRFTLLLGVIDDSSCVLEYRLHTRNPRQADEDGAARLKPGGLIFFDGDKLQHRVTRMGAGEERVSLTFEYVTDPTMRGSRRIISNFKDAIAYFGFRQVFGKLAWPGSDPKARIEAHRNTRDENERGKARRPRG